MLYNVKNYLKRYNLTYLLTLLGIILLFNTVIIFINRPEEITVFDENTKSLHVVHCALTPDKKTNFSYQILDNTVLFSTFIQFDSDWGILGKNNYFYEKKKFDLQNYESIKIRVRSLNKNNEILMLAFRTYKPVPKNNKFRNQNSGIMWRKLVHLPQKGFFCETSIPLTEFEGYEFDPVNQEFFRNYISESFSKKKASHDKKVSLMEIVLQPSGNLKGERDFEIDDIKLIKKPLFTKYTLFFTNIILILVLIIIGLSKNLNKASSIINQFEEPVISFTFTEETVEVNRGSKGKQFMNTLCILFKVKDPQSKRKKDLLFNPGTKLNNALNVLKILSENINHDNLISSNQLCTLYFDNKVVDQNAAKYIRDYFNSLNRALNEFFNENGYETDNFTIVQRFKTKDTTQYRLLCRYKGFNIPKS